MSAPVLSQMVSKGTVKWGRSLFDVWKVQLLRLFRNRQVFVFNLLVPLMMILIFGSLHRARHPQIQIVLVITQRDVVAGPVPLDKHRLQQQCFFIAGTAYNLKVGSIFHQPSGLGRMAVNPGEI